MCSCLNGGDLPGEESASSGKIGDAFEMHPIGSGSRDTAAEGGASSALAGFTLDTYAHVTTAAQKKAAETMGEVLAR